MSHGASNAKLARIATRIEYALGEGGESSERVLVDHVTLGALFTATAVIEVDRGAVPTWIHEACSHVYRFDFENDSHEGWEVLRLAADATPRVPAQTSRKSMHRFNERVSTLRAQRRDCAYIFGTGPSLDLASGRSFRDGYVVVCNTIVRDSVLWEHLAPDFVAAADAIYHFGFTPHARAFRADLRARLISKRGRTLFVYPDIFDVIVRREMGDLEELLVPVPFGRHEEIDVDLTRRFELPMLGNVLNNLLLPLGCTLSRKVALWGFDGRAPDDKLFWSNSSKHAYPELMPGLVEEHPAFYETLVPAGNESKYVKAVHGDDLDRRLIRAEQRGHRFVMLHDTWTETLQRRRGEV